ncbi:Rossmann-like and DUF2520 domain-containing protein [Microbacterium limosum]|uniref:Rossmann-like and DUF2520 domain-containing protein n=1 Tax=Microbacterium limosum TaxID=3079935 RepID=A0AAU0MG17_9MICO|nr:Rossmann-like and DUF2520 domain-containing protein [Microbacterium sp. Y20]WOQ69239.1 Rossmann-like and DUF2520 domain-containing protein [Microbacterium sp. Y20]
MIPTTPQPRRPVATVAVVGAGRLGRPLARALSAAGSTVTGPFGRDQALDTRRVDAVVLCVPDAAIADAASTVRASGFGGVIVHTSGATPLRGSGADAGLHPLQTFTGDEEPEAFAGVGCAIAGITPEALDAARALAEALGLRAFEVRDEQRAGYHAAASVASNYLVTLLDAAEQVAATAGLDGADARALLHPLVAATVANWASLGPSGALTGPVARGDDATVRRQRAAIESDAPHLLPLFDVLRDATHDLAERGRIRG